MRRKDKINKSHFASFRQARTTGNLTRTEARRAFPRKGISKVLGLYDFVVDTQIDFFDKAGQSVGLGKVGTDIWDAEKALVGQEHPKKLLNLPIGIVKVPLTVVSAVADKTLENEQKLRAIKVLSDILGASLIAVGTAAVATGNVGGLAAIQQGGIILSAGQLASMSVDKAKQYKQVETAIQELKRDPEKDPKTKYVFTSRFTDIRNNALKQKDEGETISLLIEEVKERTGVNFTQQEALDVIQEQENIDELEIFIRAIESADISPNDAEKMLLGRQAVSEDREEKIMKIELEKIEEEYKKLWGTVAPDFSDYKKSQGLKDALEKIEDIVDIPVEEELKKEKELSDQGLENTSQRETPIPSDKSPVIIVPTKEEKLEQQIKDIKPISNEDIVSREKLKEFGKDKKIINLTNKKNKQGIIDAIIANDGDLKNENTLFEDIVNGLTSAENKKQWLRSNSKLLHSLKKANPEAAEEIRDIAKQLIERDD